MDGDLMKYTYYVPLYDLVKRFEKIVIDNYCMFNFPMHPHVCLVVGWSVIISTVTSSSAHVLAKRTIFVQ